MQCNPAFELVEADIVNPLPRSLSRRKFDEVYNLACAASPPSYQADPEHTLMTSVVGTQHLLALAERCGADFLFASTSEVYGDKSEEHTSELQSLMRNSYAVFCLKKKNKAENNIREYNS